MFGVDGADPPWHFLVDPDGRIATIARGSGKKMIDRLAKQSSRWLETLEPLDEAHFACWLSPDDASPDGREVPGVAE